MRILYAAPAYKPAYRFGGPVMSVSAAAEALVRRGHSVTVVTTNSNLDEDLDVPTDQPIDVNGVEVWYFRHEEPLQRYLPFIPYLSRSVGLLYAPAMKPALQRIVPAIDVVDTHQPFVYPTYAAARAARRFGKPVFYHQRGSFDPQRLRFRGAKKKVYIRLIERPIMQSAATLIALTDAERESFRALGITTPCEVVPNGVDAVRARPGFAERMEERFGIPRTAVVILFLGRLHPIKGADKLLDAFALVEPSVRRNARLVMAGPDEWQLQQKWHERAAAAGIAGHVVFTGMVEGDVKTDLLARADLFSLPSIGEGFSMAVLEALASGSAVMLSPGCHFPEAESAGAGVTVDNEPAAMAAVLASLIASPQTVREMGIAGERLIAQSYTWERIADRLVEVYHEGIVRVASTRGAALH